MALKLCVCINKLKISDYSGNQNSKFCLPIKASLA